MGSDYCFPLGLTRPVEFVTGNATLSAAEKHAIVETNARRLLRL